MIEARDLVKRFGPLTAVNKVNFRVEPGEILGFLGPNGAGKSTTMKLITGYLRPDGGTARIGGYDIRDNPLGAKEMFGYLPESGPLYPEMTVGEFLAFAAELHGLRGAAKEEAFHRAKDLCHLESVLGQTLETLSKGYRQRVGLAQAVLHDPRYLILDEPTDGLDPNQKREVRKLIKGMAEKKAILLSTHILEEVEAMCTRVLIINHGKVVTDATPEELRHRHPDAGAVRVYARQDQLETLRSWASGETGIGLEPGDGSLILRPADRKPVAPRLLQEARSRNWHFDDLQPLPLHLDRVFAELTGNALN